MYLIEWQCDLIILDFKDVDQVRFSADFADNVRQCGHWPANLLFISKALSETFRHWLATGRN